MPYTIGLQSAVTAFASAGSVTQFTVVVIAFLVIVPIISALQKGEVDTPTSLPGFSLFHITPFFRRRYDFLNWAFHATGQSVFKFKLLRNTVVVVSGEQARQTFFTAKGLDLTEGFKILSGAIPMVRGVTSDLQTRRIALIHKRLAAVQREAHLSSLIPQLLEDSRRVMEGWNPAGKLDPFEKIYELTFQTTIRSLTGREIADDPILVSRLKTLYDKLDTGTTPATVLLPWIPTPAMLAKLWATKDIYEIVVDTIQKREELLKKVKDGNEHISAVPEDTLQMLMECGDERLVVVGFIMGLLIAGARATGTTASWLITFLAGHPEWAKKARMEIEELVSLHSNYTSKSKLKIQTNTQTEIKTKEKKRGQQQPGLLLGGDLRFNSISSLNSNSSSPISPSSLQKRKRRNSESSSDVDTDYTKSGSTTSSSSNSKSSSSSSSPLCSNAHVNLCKKYPGESQSCSKNSTEEIGKKENEKEGQAISHSLSQIPLEIWENSTPIFDALIKETTRVAQPHTAMRRNIGPEMHIDGKLVPSGAYVIYPFSDVHLDESIYEDAWKFDPSRWLEDEEVSGEKLSQSLEENEKTRSASEVKRNKKDAPFGYVGWGGGNTTCLGTRLAKVELKLILAMFVLGYDLDLVTKTGQPLPSLPVPNWNDILLCRPPKDSFFIGYAKKDVEL